MSTAAAPPGNAQRGDTVTITAVVDTPGTHNEPDRFEWKQMAFTPAIHQATDAPVAARVQSSYTFPSVRGDGTADIRTMDGHFYIQKVDIHRAPLTTSTPHLGDYLRLYVGGYRTAEEATAAMLNAAAGIITIDGHLWTRVDEPRLVIHPQGIRIDVVPGPVNRAREAFALTENDQAIARAAELLHESGKAAYPSATNPIVAVLMPDVFTERHP